MKKLEFKSLYDYEEWFDKEITYQKFHNKVMKAFYSLRKKVQMKKGNKIYIWIDKYGLRSGYVNYKKKFQYEIELNVIWKYYRDKKMRVDNFTQKEFINFQGCWLSFLIINIDKKKKFYEIYKHDLEEVMGLL